MNANEMLRIEYTILILQEPRDQISIGVDHCSRPLWEAGWEK